MSSRDGLPIPETRVLAIASHVVYGYVGNTMATFVMQALGCEVAALNTVQYSNHVAYKHFTGYKTSAAEIRELYAGLAENHLDEDFDVLLSGYIPGAEAVEAVGDIARSLKKKVEGHPGRFFWVLDPVMGDEGRLYVNEDVVPAYKKLLHTADMIVPNQFEAELLSEITIDSLDALKLAMTTLHARYHIPHIIITSARLPSDDSSLQDSLSTIGSTCRTDHTPRLFRIDIPAIDHSFSGTGDMFAALTVARFREACSSAGLFGTTGWTSGDDVPAEKLPLARAAEKVLGSMQTVLVRTKEVIDRDMAGFEGDEKARHLRKTRAAEVRLVRNVDALKEPQMEYSAKAL